MKQLTVHVMRLLVALVIVYFSGHANCVRANTMTLTPTGDAYVQDGKNANTNYGTAPTLVVQTDAFASKNFDSYLKFDASTVSGIVASAKLLIYADLSGPGSLSTTAYAVADTSWSETSITWNNKPALGAALNSASVSGTAYAWVAVDVTAYVQAQFNAGVKVVSFAFHDSANSNRYITAYSNNSTVADAPQLAITPDNPPTVSLTAPANNAVIPAPANISLTATAADSDGTVGKVQYFSGATLIATGGAAPAYAATWANVPAGAYSITAVATDNLGASTTSAPVSVIVDAPPMVSIATPADHAVIPAPGNIGLSAVATDSDGTVAKVNYYNGAALVANSTTPPSFAAIWANVPVGAYSFTATAIDNQGLSATSTPITVTVDAPPTASLTAPANGATYPAPASFTLTAAASDSDGTVQKVDFYQNGNLLGSNSSAPYNYSVSNLPGGSYGFTVTATDNNGLATTSAPISVTVKASGSMTAPINYVYDENARLISVYDAIGNSAQYSYDPVGNLLAIHRSNAGAVSILDFSPDAAPAGAAVTITGTGFSATASQNSVSFNGAPATLVSATVNTLSVTVPATASSGPISVVSPAGSATSSSSFIVSATATGGAAPTISGFSPAVVAAGTTVTVSGTGFQTSLANDRVSINGLAVTIAAATSTSLSIVIPPNIGSGKISLVTPYGSTVSSGDLIIAPPGYSAASIGYSGRISVAGNTLTFTTPTGLASMILFDGSVGQFIGLGLSGMTTVPVGGSVNVAVLNPNGSMLISCVGASGTSGSCELPGLPKAGTYTVFITQPSTSASTATLTLSSDVNLGTAVQNGPLLNFSTTRVGQDADFNFNGTAGETLSIDWSGSTISNGMITVYQPDGAMFSTAYFATGSGTLPLLNLPATGNYLVFFAPSNPYVGQVNLGLSGTGSLTVDGPPSVLSLPAGQNTEYFFSGTAGQLLGLGISGVSTTPAGGYLNETVINPNGSALGNCPITYSSSGNSCNIPVLPTTGTYAVAVTPSGLDAANFTLTLSSDINLGTAVQNGPLLNFSTARVGQSAYFAFNGVVGEDMSIDWSNNTIALPGYDAITVLQPSGAQYKFQPLNASSGSALLFNLPATGSYWVFVQPYYAAVGQINLGLNATGSAIIDGAPSTLGLTTGQNGYYSFSGTAGQTVGLGLSNLATTPAGGYVTVWVVNPNGSILSDCGAFGGTGDNCNLAVLPATGTYNVIVTPSGFDPASFLLTLSSEVDLGTLTLNGPLLTFSTTRVGQKALLTFDATAGQSVTLDWSGNTIPQGAITISQPSGAVYATTIFYAGSRTLSLASLPATGSYSVYIDPAYTYTGQISFGLQ